MGLSSHYQTTYGINVAGCGIFHVDHRLRHSEILCNMEQTRTFPAPDLVDSRQHWMQVVDLGYMLSLYGLVSQLDVI